MGTPVLIIGNDMQKRTSRALRWTEIPSRFELASELGRPLCGMRMLKHRDAAWT
jgi:hypothetical protein